MAVSFSQVRDRHAMRMPVLTPDQGGFSNYFARPSYQDAAVTKFLTSVGTKFAGMFK